MRIWKLKTFPNGPFGNIFITGGFYDPIITFDSVTLTKNGSNGNMFLVKCDPDGNVLWARNPATGGNGGASVKTDLQGNAIVGGGFGDSIVLGSFVLRGVGSSSDIFIVKYDQSGNILWAKSAGGYDDFDDIKGLSTDASGSVYATGQSASSFVRIDSFTIAGGNPYPFNAFVIKMNANGEVQWLKNNSIKGLSVIDIEPRIGADANGNVYIIGNFRTPFIQFDSIILYNADTTNHNSKDFFVVKYDTNGNVIWAERGGGSTNDRIYDLAISAIGNVFLTGYFSNTDIILGSVSLPDVIGGGCVGAGMFTIKLDSDGNFIWEKRGTGGESYCIAIDDWENVFTAGEIGCNYLSLNPFTVPRVGSGTDIFVAKLGTATAIKETENNISISLFPNPASTQLFIQTNGIEIEQVNIYNTTGSLVMAALPQTANYKLETANFASGVYITEIKTKEGSVRKRWVKM